MGTASNVPQSFAAAIEAVAAAIGRSAVLRRLGYAEFPRELRAESSLLPATCRFALRPCSGRRLDIDFCYQRDGNHYFTVTVNNLPAADSFLLEEWLSLRGVSLSPYPFILSSYAGGHEERLAGFVAFLDQHLAAERLADILAGANWEYIPYDWGDLK